jgi:probable phosphoglycerate mutase
MTILLLIRHGENDYYIQKKLPGRLPDIHLNDLGRQKAEALITALVGRSVIAIYSSPLERAVETALPLARHYALEIQLHEGLNELDCGDWKGKSISKLQRLKAWKSVQQESSRFKFPGGESFMEAQNRVSSALMEIQANHGEDEVVACFTHCDMIRLAVAHFLGMPLDDFQRLSAEPASITTIYLGKGNPRLINLNTTAIDPVGISSHPITTRPRK